jgi:hypothetical protein
VAAAQAVEGTRLRPEYVDNEAPPQTIIAALNFCPLSTRNDAKKSATPPKNNSDFHSFGVIWRV